MVKWKVKGEQKKPKDNVIEANLRRPCDSGGGLILEVSLNGAEAVSIGRLTERGFERFKIVSDIGIGKNLEGRVLTY